MDGLSIPINAAKHLYKNSDSPKIIHDGFWISWLLIWPGDLSKQDYELLSAAINTKSC